MRRLLPLFAALAALTLPALAQASSDDTGTLGVGEYLSIDLAGTKWAARAQPEFGKPDRDYTGLFGFARVHVGGTLIKTRFDNPMGMELSFALGWWETAAVTDNADKLKEMSFGRLYMELDTCGSLGLLGFKVLDRRFRLLALGGGGMFPGAYYLYAGGRLAAEIIPNRLHLEANYTFRPGLTGGDGDGPSRQHRASAHLVIGLPVKVAVGAEVWKGVNKYDEKSPDTLPTAKLETRSIKGDYLAVLGMMSIRFGDD